MKKIRLFLVSIAILASYIVTAQVSINTDGANPDASSILDLKSTDKGILIPRMTQTEIEAITNPANSLMVFNTTDEKLYVYSYLNSNWKEVQFGSSEIFMPATYSIGTAGSCANTSVNGTYTEAVALDASNTVNVDATVTSIGSWSITTDTINGYSYSGSGTFTTTGTVQFTLDGSGTPTTAQTDNFTATANLSGGSCTFDVFVAVAPCISFTYGGQSYSSVQIGTQCWMAENLNIGTMINGGTNQSNNSTIEKYCFGNNSTNCDTYGGLYQWNEIMQYVTTEGTQGICPAGWHLPTDGDWCILENFVDTGTIDCNSFSYRGLDGGGNLKETGTSHWQAPNTGATNSSGFTGLPGGYRDDDGQFYTSGNTGFWYSSSNYTGLRYYRYLNTSNSQIGRYYSSVLYGFSVRCIRD